MTNTKQFLLASLTLMGLTFPTYAEDVTLKRFETESMIYDVNYESVTPLKDGSMIVIVDDKRKTKENNICALTYRKYDKDLTLVDSVEFSFNRWFYDTYYMTDDYIYRQNKYCYKRKDNFLGKKGGLSNLNTEGVNKDELQLTRTKISDFTSQTISFDLNQYPRLEFQCAIDDDLYFWGVKEKENIVYLLYKNITTGTETKMDVHVQDAYRNWIYISTNEKDKEVYAIVENDAQTYTFYVFKEGQIVSQSESIVEQDIRLYGYNVTKTSDGGYLIYGAIRENKYGYGIFSHKIKEGKLVFKNHTNYVDIKGFVSHLDEKVRKEVERCHAKGRTDCFNQQQIMTLYKMEECNGHYILVGEVYQPKYQTKYDGKQPYPFYKVFVGNEYTHYSVIAINQEGQTVWTNSATLEVKLTMTDNLNHLTIKTNDEGVSVTYPTFNDVHTTLFKNDGAMNETTTHYSDKIVEESKHRTVEIYKANEMRTDLNGNFYFSGYEWIPKGKKEERVYFINKVEVR